MKAVWSGYDFAFHLSSIAEVINLGIKKASTNWLKVATPNPF